MILLTRGNILAENAWGTGERMIIDEEITQLIRNFDVDLNKLMSILNNYEMKVPDLKQSERDMRIKIIELMKITAKLLQQFRDRQNEKYHSGVRDAKLLNQEDCGYK